MARDKTAVKILADNRKARFDFHVDETLEVGIQLQGTEVKSLRAGKFSFADSYARVKAGELWLIGLHITPYEQGNIFNHQPDRERKLLAKAAQIRWLERKTDEKGFTLIPLKVYLKGGLVKVDLGLCKGKKNYDKREAIKTRDELRAAQREFKGQRIKI